MIFKAREEAEKHLRDKTRAEYLDMLVFKHANAMEEANKQYQNHKATNTGQTHHGNVCDVLFEALFSVKGRKHQKGSAVGHVPHP